MLLAKAQTSKVSCSPWRQQQFNQDISDWDVTKSTSFESMFLHAMASLQANFALRFIVCSSDASVVDPCAVESNAMFFGAVEGATIKADPEDTTRSGCGSSSPKFEEESQQESRQEGRQEGRQGGNKPIGSLIFIYSFPTHPALGLPRHQ
jgi:hypothetical protein